MLKRSDMLSNMMPWPFARRQQDVPDYLQQYLDAPRPDEYDSWRSVPYCVLDMETTGLNPRRDSILSIGLVCIEDARIHMNNQWYTLVRPPDDVTVPVESIRIHGLLRNEVAEAPTFEEILPELMEYLYGRVLVVHYSPIDVGFLNRTLRTLYNTTLRGPAIDTILLAQTLHEYEHLTGGHHATNQGGVTTLSALAEKSNIPIHAQHNALGDAITTAQLFLSQATRMEKYGFESLRKILKAGRCLR